MRRLAITALSCAACAHGPQGNAWAHYELTGSHDVDPAAAPAPVPPSELVLAGVRLHGLVGNHRFGYAAAADLAAGATIRGGGFAYDVALLPIGAGVRLGASSAIMLGAGVGAMGAIGALDDAVTLPLQLTGEFSAGGARVLTRARISYVGAAPSRDRGAPTLSFVDEAEAMLALRLGGRTDVERFPAGNGYFAGVAYRELLGSRFVGLTIGYSIDLASRPPTHPN